jgi:hypothetical protein
VESYPSGAECYFKGKRVGTTPCDVPVFLPTVGNSVAEIVLPGWHPDETKWPEHDSLKLTLLSAPTGAVVTKNGKRLGPTPLIDWGGAAHKYKVVWDESVTTNPKYVNARNEKKIYGTTIEPPKPTPVAGNRWAVVVGVSSFLDPRLPKLAYAEKDAQSIYDWLVSSEGGQYAVERVVRLLGPDATATKIRDALSTRLQGVGKDDTVTVFFSGHGRPQSPEALNNLYLVSYDTNIDSMPATAIPMWDIHTFLRHYIHARNVFVFADACYSGAIGNIGVPSNAEDVTILTSTSPVSLSYEDSKWQGHGAFTHSLLEGLSGKADSNKDGVVTIGELVVYTSEDVIGATSGIQHPKVGGFYDPSLVFCSVKTKL